MICTGREVLAANRVDGVEDLAYDWISKNLYWTDPRYRSISVMRLADKSRRTIIRNLNNPRAIVVHPVAGYVRDYHEICRFACLTRRMSNDKP